MKEMLKTELLNECYGVLLNFYLERLMILPQIKYMNIYQDTLLWALVFQEQMHKLLESQLLLLLMIVDYLTNINTFLLTEDRNLLKEYLFKVGSIQN